MENRNEMLLVKEKRNVLTGFLRSSCAFRLIFVSYLFFFGTHTCLRLCISRS